MKLFEILNINKIINDEIPYSPQQDVDMSKQDYGSQVIYKFKCSGYQYGISFRLLPMAELLTFNDVPAEVKEIITQIKNNNTSTFNRLQYVEFEFYTHEYGYKHIKANGLKVMQRVLTSLVDFDATHNVDAYYFSANSQSKVNLYSHLLKRFTTKYAFNIIAGHTINKQKNVEFFLFKSNLV